MAREGASGKLRSIVPPISPAVWTTLATGKLPSEHGITDFLKPDGSPQTARDRKAPAVWELLSAAGRTVCLAGYMVTWPAEAVRGVMISDLPFNDPAAPTREAVAFPADALRGYPGDVLPLLAPEALERFLRVPWNPGYHRLPRGSAEYAYHHKVDQYLATAYNRDETLLRVAEHLLRRAKPDFFAIHLWGVDRTSHGFSRYSGPAALDSSLEDVYRMGPIVREYYEYVDEAVGRLLALAGPDATILVVSDHGFRLDPGVDFGAEGEHSLGGVLLARGPGIAAGVAVEGASVLDVAPTVLHLSGLPVPEDMHGRVLTRMLEPGALAAAPVRRGPAAAARRPAALPPAPGLGASEVEMLKAMGYLK